jgi:hypothetical protein
MVEPTWLGPWDAGICFKSDPTSVKDLRGAYRVVRWRDRWGTRWEYRPDEVHRIGEDEPWAP